MSTITKIKLFIIIKILSRWKRFVLRMKGVTVGRDCAITGKVKVYKWKGSKITVGNEVSLQSNPKYNPLTLHPLTLVTLLPDACIELKDHCGIGGCIIEACTKVTIGEYTVVGPGTVIYDSKGHNYDPETGWFWRKKREGKPITIGKRCYIGMNCVILKGVTIGDDCVISAGTIINKDVPSGHIAFGNPAQYSLLPEHLRQGVEPARGTAPQENG